MTRRSLLASVLAVIAVACGHRRLLSARLQEPSGRILSTWRHSWRATPRRMLRHSISKGNLEFLGVAR